MPNSRWHLFDDPRSVAQAAAWRVVIAADRAIRHHGHFSMVLAGGSTPEATYRLLAEADTDWSKWRIYFGDERCLPDDDVQRNSVMAAAAWLDRVYIPAEHIHPIQAQRGAAEAAASYAKLVAAALPFDLVLLGMGEDGHTASLFPGQSHAHDELVHAVHEAPKPPPERVSLSREALSDCHELLILVTGKAKRQALARWKSGDPLPVACIGARHAIDVLIDRDAGGE